MRREKYRVIRYDRNGIVNFVSWVEYEHCMGVRNAGFDFENYCFLQGIPRQRPAASLYDDPWDPTIVCYWGYGGAIRTSRLLFSVMRLLLVTEAQSSSKKKILASSRNNDFSIPPTVNQILSLHIFYLNWQIAWNLISFVPQTSISHIELIPSKNFFHQTLAPYQIDAILTLS